MARRAARAHAGALLAARAPATVALYYLLLIEKLPIALPTHFCGRFSFLLIIFVCRLELRCKWLKLGKQLLFALGNVLACARFLYSLLKFDQLYSMNVEPSGSGLI